jgi:hypothetical protein
MSLHAGCIPTFGPYEVDASGSLSWTDGPASTLIGCPDDLAAQDRWLGMLNDDVTHAVKITESAAHRRWTQSLQPRTLVNPSGRHLQIVDIHIAAILCVGHG